jgi:hypothetical protein
MANVDNIEAWEAGRLRNILYNARKTWRLSTPRHLEILDAVEVGRDYDNGRVSYRDNFMGSMAYALDKFGKLTPKQSEAVLKGIDARAAKRAEWASEKAAVDAKREHIGTVGEKSTITLTVKHIVTLEGVYGISYLHICEDADNNIIIYKGNASGFPRTGETATVVATIKDHGVREGVKQTVIQRPKLAK